MDFNDLPADAQLLNLNIQDKIRERLAELGAIKNTPEGRREIVKATIAAHAQTVEDCGGIRVTITNPETREVWVSIPRAAFWPLPDE